MRCVRGRTIAAVLALAAAAIGCGDELAEFRIEELSPLEQRANAQKARLAATLRTVELRDHADARLIEKQLPALARTFAQLAELEPPDDYRETYSRFVENNARFLRYMRQFAAALRQGDEEGVSVASERAKEAIGMGQRAIQPLHG